ncbi:CbtA family protein [Nocardioides pyridinolyticus]
MSRWHTNLRASLLGGLAAGGVAAAFTLLVLEPTIELALAIEESRTAAGHAHGDLVHDTALVSRGWQQVGGALAVVVSALLLSLVYSVVLSRFRRTWNLGEMPAALLVALGCFAVFALAPGLKYPANPPAVGDPATVTERTTLYVGSVVLAALVAAAVLMVAGTARRLDWSATRTCWTMAAVVTAGGILLFAALPPSPDAIPGDVGAGLVWRFRLQSLGMLALLWATIGLVSGTVLARQSRADRTAAHGRRAVTSG